MMYVAVEDTAGARRALERAGLKISDEQEVVAVPVDDRPGAAGEVLRRIADAGVNIELAYIATGPRIVVAAHDVGKAQATVRHVRESSRTSGR